MVFGPAPPPSCATHSQPPSPSTSTYPSSTTSPQFESSAAHVSFAKTEPRRLGFWWGAKIHHTLAHCFIMHPHHLNPAFSNPKQVPSARIRALNLVPHSIVPCLKRTLRHHLCFLAAPPPFAFLIGRPRAGSAPPVWGTVAEHALGIRNLRVRRA